jgi:YrbI family 3-deoxy-D-manno-octulosonate 8-phosphate phosphatase
MNVQILATDVDGTLTDGGMYYSPSGEISKRFYVRDGLGGQLLQAIGIQVAFISSDSSSVIEGRAKRLGIDYCFSGVKNKVEIIQRLCAQNDIDLAQVAFLGDDLQDLAVMQCVGLAGAVGDAHPLILEAADYICEKAGGFGAFREFAEILLLKHGVSIQDAFERYQGLKSQNK